MGVDIYLYEIDENRKNGIEKITFLMVKKNKKVNSYLKKKNNVFYNNNPENVMLSEESSLFPAIKTLFFENEFSKTNVCM